MTYRRLQTFTEEVLNPGLAIQGGFLEEAVPNMRPKISRLYLLHLASLETRALPVIGVVTRDQGQADIHANIEPGQPDLLELDLNYVACSHVVL